MLLALLLLFAQSQQLEHPFAHITIAAEASDVSLGLPASSDACVECPLLVSGANVVAGAHVAATKAALGPLLVQLPVTARVADARAWFDSRAPPHFR